MSKITVVGTHNVRVIVSTDGKDQAQPSSAGVAVTSVKVGNNQVVHGQVTGTTVIHDNPA